MHFYVYIHPCNSRSDEDYEHSHLTRWDPTSSPETSLVPFPVNNRPPPPKGHHCLDLCYYKVGFSSLEFQMYEIIHYFLFYV